MKEIKLADNVNAPDEFREITVLRKVKHVSKFMNSSVFVCEIDTFSHNLRIFYGNFLLICPKISSITHQNLSKTPLRLQSQNYFQNFRNFRKCYGLSTCGYVKIPVSDSIPGLRVLGKHDQARYLIVQLPLAINRVVLWAF